MDMFSHAVVGLAVAGLSGHQPTLHDPIYIATILGAQAPDFDIIAQVRGNMAYLRQHRSFSHSVPGILVWSLAVAFITRLLTPQAAFGQAFLWSFAGGVSHICLDYFNTHGVAILWPFRKERKSCPLLNVFDPILLVAMLVPHLSRQPLVTVSEATFAILAVYILGRYLLRRRAVHRLKKYFSCQGVARIWVMPCLNHVLCWDFVVETEQHNLNGRLSIISHGLRVLAALPKQKLSPLTRRARKTVLGQFFLTFSPFTYFEESTDKQSPKVKIYDLRYYADKRFIHSATIIFNQNNVLSESYIHSLGRTIKVQTAS